MNQESIFINKLTKETLKGNILWNIVNHKGIELPHDEKVTSKVYTATVSSKKIRVYEYQYKHYVDEEEWLWKRRARLEMIDDNSERLYEFEYDYSLYDLFNSIAKMTANVDDFINNFLNSAEE